MKTTYKIFLALFLLSQMAMAQTSRFIYQVTMKLDSTAAAKVENAYLDVSPTRSLFYAENRLKRDSLIEKMRATRNFDRNAMQNLNTNIDYIIGKDYAKNTTIFKDRIARDQYFYEEERQMVWKILPETVKIGVYETQKAETTFAGRKWSVWFTQEIPFQDGPYKFKGLPGLIVKAEDAKGDYSFDLKETKKINELPNFDARLGTMIKVKRTDFLKQQKKFMEDPMSFFQSSGMAFRGSAVGGAGAPTPPQGIENADPDRRKRMEERIKEEAKKNNNPIEFSK